MSFTEEQWLGHLGVIQLPNGQTIGSGFVYGPQRQVVTCAHVVAGAYHFYHETNLFFGPQSPPLRALVLKHISPALDLAVLSPTPPIGGPPLKFGSMSKVKPGEQIIYIGYDQRRTSEGKVWSLAHGATVSAIGCAMNEGCLIDFIEFEGEGIPGYSGGPVFNQSGELIAVMREAWTKRGVKGGPEVLVNRAFSIQALEQLEKSVSPPVIPPVTGNTNHAGAVLLDVFDLPVTLEKKN